MSAESVAPRKRPTLWHLRWEAWREGVSVRELWRIARFYRRELRRMNAAQFDGHIPCEWCHGTGVDPNSSIDDPCEVCHGDGNDPDSTTGPVAALEYLAERSQEDLRATLNDGTVPTNPRATSSKLVGGTEHNDGTPDA